MGGANSHESCQSTPPRDSSNCKFLPIDPRSPSTDINRTPILVEKTPEGALDPMLDPRSPTAGIYRTPISGLPLSKQDSEISNETSAIPPLDLDLLEFPKVTEVNPQKGTSVTDERDETDPLGVIGLQNLSMDEIPTDESTRLVNMKPEKAIAETEKRPKKTSKAAQPKELFPNKKGLAIKDNTRSPLSTRNVDMNSPLQIIQRKQTNKLDKARKHSVGSPSARFIVNDKENM